MPDNDKKWWKNVQQITYVRAIVFLHDQNPNKKINKVIHMKTEREICPDL